LVCGFKHLGENQIKKTIMKKLLVNITLSAGVLLILFGIFTVIPKQPVDFILKAFILLCAALLAWGFQGLVNAIQGEKTHHDPENNKRETNTAGTTAGLLAILLLFLPKEWDSLLYGITLISVGVTSGLLSYFYFWKRQS